MYRWSVRLGAQGLDRMIQTRQSCEFVIHIERNTEMVEAGEAMTVESIKGRVGN